MSTPHIRSQGESYHKIFMGHEMNLDGIHGKFLPHESPNNAWAITYSDMFSSESLGSFKKDAFLWQIHGWKYSHEIFILQFLGAMKCYHGVFTGNSWHFHRSAVHSGSDQWIKSMVSIFFHMSRCQSSQWYKLYI